MKLPVDGFLGDTRLSLLFLRLAPPISAKQVAAPAEQSVWLDNVQSLVPELSTRGQEDQSNAIASGELGPFYLTVEHNELLSQYCIFGNQVSAAIGIRT